MSMFGASDFFESDLAKSFGVPNASQPCPEHEVAPVPIKGRAELQQPFLLLQFRPAFALQVLWVCGMGWHRHMKALSFLPLDVVSKRCPSDPSPTQPQLHHPPKQLYLRLARCPYVARNLEYPALETAGRLPVLVDGHFVLPEEETLAYLGEHYPDCDLDARLSGAKRAQVEAFTALLQDRLEPALRGSRSRDERNFGQNVRAAVLRATRFPLGAAVSKAERRRNLEEQRWRGLLDGGVGLGEVLARAHRVYRELDKWLEGSTGEWFFGREPTSFDCRLFGHLAEALADANLLVFLSGQPSLMRFFRRVADDVFDAVTPAPSASASAPSSTAAAAASTTSGFAVPSELAEYYRRANYVNARNAFNQVGAARLCAEAPLVPEPMVHKFLEEGEGPKGGPAAAAGGGAAGGGKGGVGDGGKAGGGVEGSGKKAELEEERERRKQNVLWLTVVGSVASFFMIAQGLIALVAAAGELQVAGDGEEEEEEGAAEGAQ